MISPAKPYNERQRLETLRSLNILDTDPEERFDRFTRLAAALFRVPIALVTLVDANRQWFKSKHGLDVCETSREISFCGHAILSDEVLVIEDATADERFFDNPLVTSDPNIRFYAGYPLSAPDGSNVGTLCVIGREPRKMSPHEFSLLRELGRSIEYEMLALSRSTVDEMTSLSNLRGFEAMAAHTISLCRRLGQPATFLYIRVKNVAQIATQAGLDRLNQALVEFAQMLIVAFRESDVIGRVGDHEFGVLLTGTADKDAEKPVNRIQDMLSDYNGRAGQECRLDIAMLAMRYDPGRHGSIDDMITAAAAALEAPAEAPQAAIAVAQAS